MTIKVASPMQWNVFFQSSVMDNNEQKDQVISGAIHRQDMEQLREIFSREHDKTRAILLDYETSMELMFWSLLVSPSQAKDWCMDRLYELSSDRYDSDKTLKIIEKLKDYLLDSSAHDLSDEFYKALHVAFKELYKILMSPNFSQYLPSDIFTAESTTYLEIALNLRDPLLVSAIIRSGLYFNSKERESFRRLFNSPFTESKQNLILTILAYHYKIEDLLPEGETIKDLMTDAFLEKDKYLLIFLGQQGCDVSKYLELIEVGFSDWVYTTYSDGRITETVKRLDTNEIIEL